MGLRAELQEFVDSVKTAKEDGSVSVSEVHVVLRQAFDCIGPLAAVIDVENAAAVAELSAEALQAVEDAIDALPDGRLGVKPVAKMAAGYVIPSLVKQVAEYGKPYSVYIDDVVLPQLNEIETTIRTLRVSLGG
jgi:hypothetical protein